MNNMPDRYSTPHLPEDQHERGSNGTVLRNLLGITESAKMEYEEEIRYERLVESALVRFDQSHRFTASNILWLHKTWLKGVFPWAGTYRTVNIGKGGFMFAAAAHVPELMRQFENDQLVRLRLCASSSGTKMLSRRWQRCMWN